MSERKQEHVGVTVEMAPEAGVLAGMARVGFHAPLNGWQGDELSVFLTLDSAAALRDALNAFLAYHHRGQS